MKCFGKLPKKNDLRTLKFPNYAKALPGPPAAVDWIARSHISEWGMMGNGPDSTDPALGPNFPGCGNCTVVAAGHMIMMMTKLAGKPIVPTTAQIIKAYSDITLLVNGVAYDPSQTDENGNNPTDTGLPCLDVLKYWRKTGIAGHKIRAFAEIHPQNQRAMHQADDLFISLYTGVALPKNIRNLMNPGNTWSLDPNWQKDPDAQPGSLGGHCIPVPTYNRVRKGFISWAAEMFMEDPWQLVYMDEAYAVVDDDFIDKHGLSPTGLNVTQLLSDLASIT